ncbi:hypothetical protein B0T24DRAFT_673370 [Lasiosphaeria ovina]|uniref:Uncharacterized protein n=1 Tax=Lasiosphaeria ovina TaxID=92902 RepID=A0AAE0NL71_9PEZI|nr:hypothetical protein B0T24DRAFT_673370 [Lasiosphaeria ovina]
MTLSNLDLTIFSATLVGLADASETRTWALLRARTTFKALYRSNSKFVWQMAGRQLVYIKAQMTRGDGTPAPQYVTRIEGDGSEYPDADDADREADGDAHGWGFGGYDDY